MVPSIHARIRMADLDQKRHVTIDTLPSRVWHLTKQALMQGTISKKGIRTE